MHRNINPSPSLAARQPPGGGGQLMTGGPADNNINSQLMAIPQANMTLIKQELGIEQKDFSTFTPADKVCRNVTSLEHGINYCSSSNKY